MDNNKEKKNIMKAMLITIVKRMSFQVSEEEPRMHEDLSLIIPAALCLLWLFLQFA